MRNWSVRELEKILADLSFIEDISDEADCEWLNNRITMRKMHGTLGPAQCDACGIWGDRLMCFVDEYSDDMGGPSTLGLTNLCFMDR